MSTLAIGDIHGNVAALTDLLSRMGAHVAAGDIVVFLGDYIDRGANTKECVDAILEFAEQTPASVVCLRGNHEDWMLRTARDYTRHSWLLGMGALETIQSYSPEAAEIVRAAAKEAGLRLYLERLALPYELFFDSMPGAHRKFFERLALCHETADCVCSHAGLNPSRSVLAEQTSEDLVWGHHQFPADYRGDQLVVYGHRNCPDLGEDGWPKLRIDGRTVGIDTISHGVLTALRLPDRHVIRSGWHAC